MAPIEDHVGEKITSSKWKGKVVAWRESTTTSPSGCHLGHFKALIWRFAKDTNTDEGQIMYQKQIDLIDAQIVYLIMHVNIGIPMNAGKT
eukprot:12470780-Ditylum_brightwellii.AAC.1